MGCRNIGSQQHSSSHDSDNEGIGPQNGTFDPPLEEEYDNEGNVLRSCKRIIFYQWALVKRNEIAKQINSLNVNNKKGREDYLNYILNNMLLGNIGRHGKGQVYTNWSLKYSKKQCVTNITKIQGIIEKHNDSLKHIYLNKKMIVLIQWFLYLSKLLLQRQYCIGTARQTPKGGRMKTPRKMFKLPTETFKQKKNFSHGFYQTPPKAKFNTIDDDFPSEWRWWSGEEHGIFQLRWKQFPRYWVMY